MEVLVGSVAKLRMHVAKLRMHEMREGDARRLVHSVPERRGNSDCSFLAHFPWLLLHSCLELFLLHSSLETFHGVPTVHGIQVPKTSHIVVILSCGCNFSSFNMHTQYIVAVTFA